MHEAFLQETLNTLESKGLKRTLKVLKGAQGPRITIDGKNVLNLCSNNYLGLADDKRLKDAAIESLSQVGVGSGASRLVCGNMEQHVELERILAEFKGTESCIVFSTGYMANVGIISSLFGRGDMILSDKLNHASIVDGIVLSGAQFRRYRHNDMDNLQDLLKKSTAYKKRVIITDSVFSMDGDIAPLDTIVSLARRYEVSVMIDEAHAFGVFGKKGKGLVEHFGLEKDIDIQMGTLSKAVGSFGAYCCGSKALISFLINRARSFIYTTGMPPAVAASSMRALDIIQNEPQRRKILWDNTRYLLGELKEIGFNTLHCESPIIPVVVKDSGRAVDFSRRLFDEGIFVQAIRPPTVPQNTARLRVTVMATHTNDDLMFAVERFKKIGKELCVI